MKTTTALFLLLTLSACGGSAPTEALRATPVADGATPAVGAPAVGAPAPASGDSGLPDAMTSNDGDASTALDTSVSDACTLVTHSNGVGQTFDDCDPLGTHGLSEALKACEAWGQAEELATYSCVAHTCPVGAGSWQEICDIDRVTNDCLCWSENGHVRAYGGPSCCAGATDPLWN